MGSSRLSPASAILWLLNSIGSLSGYGEYMPTIHLAFMLCHCVLLENFVDQLLDTGFLSGRLDRLLGYAYMLL
jgi:hypothetical protein